MSCPDGLTVPADRPSAPPAIRVADASDIEAIVRVTNRAYEVEQFCLRGDRTDAADVGALMTAGQFLVVDDPTGRFPLRGSVYLAITGERGYLGMLSVDPACQGTGLARALVEAVEMRSRLAGCLFLDLSVVILRQELFPFYARFGFSQTTTLPFPKPDKILQPLHLVQMTKALGPGQEP